MEARRRIAILISGRGSNMEALVTSAQQGLLREVCEVAVVVSNRADALGIERARALGVPALVVESKGVGRDAFEDALLSALEPYAVDCLVLAGFMRILSGKVVSRYRGRIVNIHPADTRRHQGLGGYEWAFEQRLSSTCITVHLVDEGLDTGPVLARQEVDLQGATSLDEVRRRGLQVEHRLYPAVLREFIASGFRASGVGSAL